MEVYFRQLPLLDPEMILVPEHGNRMEGVCSFDDRQGKTGRPNSSIVFDWNSIQRTSLVVEVIRIRIEEKGLQALPTSQPSTADGSTSRTLQLRRNKPSSQT